MLSGIGPSFYPNQNNNDTNVCKKPEPAKDASTQQPVSNDQIGDREYHVQMLIQQGLTREAAEAQYDYFS